MMTSLLVLALGTLSLSTTNLVTAFLPLGKNLHPDSQEALAERTYFYAGGKYVNSAEGSGSFKVGQIYTERLVPTVVKKRHPIVFIHGSGQTGANFLNTPDNRPGWASLFLREGYIVYLTDQPQRGRSPFSPADSFATSSVESVEDYFTAPEKLRPLPYPQAKKHDQWPGTGLRESEPFEAFYASQVPSLTNATLTAELALDAYSELLKSIGDPVVLVTHSQSGQFGWQIADALPDLMKGLVQIEPGSGPFETWTGTPYAEGYAPKFSDTPYGLTLLPLKYEPDIGEDPSLLKTERHQPKKEDLAPCILQAEPARKLVNLAKVPELQVVGEASWHAVFDYCSVEYLRQAGVEVEFVPLESRGLKGNGHFCFLEKNSQRIFREVILPWVGKLESEKP